MTALSLKRAAAAAALGLVIHQAGAQTVLAQEVTGIVDTLETQETDKVTDISLVRANLTAWLAAFNAKDIDALMEQYDAESSYAGASGPYLTSLEDIRALYSAGFDAINATLLFFEEKAVAGSDMALIVGKFYFAPPEGSDATGLTGRVALVYRKQADGSWKLLFDMDNAGADVSPQDFQ